MRFRWIGWDAVAAPGEGTRQDYSKAFLRSCGFASLVREASFVERQTTVTVMLNVEC